MPIVNKAAQTVVSVNRDILEQKVKDMYVAVAETPHSGEFHFEMGRAMAERLGYLPEDLDRIPQAALESFAGVGYYFDYLDLQPGEHVIDFGSGSGTDTFVAALKVGAGGKVVGVEMTDAQLIKAQMLRAEGGFDNVSYLNGHIQSVPQPAASFDAVISNGVFNLAPDKQEVLSEAARLLKPGGRLAIADIVTEVQLPHSITCDATLWAACIGGAMQVDGYFAAIRAAGLTIQQSRENPQYQFLSDQANGATETFGVRSISLLATKD